MQCKERRGTETLLCSGMPIRWNERPGRRIRPAEAPRDLCVVQDALVVLLEVATGAKTTFNSCKNFILVSSSLRDSPQCIHCEFHKKALQHWVTQHCLGVLSWGVLWGVPRTSLWISIGGISCLR